MLKKLYRKWLSGPIAKSTIKTTFVLGLRLVVQAGTLLCVARMLGPEQFGAFAGVAALAVLMGTFATFGTHLVLLGEVSKDPASRAGVLAYAVPTTLITGSLLFALYLGIFQLGFSSLGLSLTAMACIGLTEMLILPLFLLPATEQLALEKTAQSQLLIVTPLALRMLAALAVMLAAPEQPLTLFANLYLGTALAALGMMKLYKRDGWLRIKDWHLPRLAQLKHSSGYATLAMTAAGPSELDKMLAVKLMPLGASGLYAAASRVIGAAVLPVTALLLSAMPKLFRVSNRNSEQTGNLTYWVFGAVFIYSLSLSALIWGCAPLIAELFGEKYIGLGEAIRWLCLAIPALALRYTAGSILITMNAPWLRAGFEIIGVFVLTLAAIAIAPRLGIYGMPVALACSEWGMAIAGTVMIVKLRKKTIAQ